MEWQRYVVGGVSDEDNDTEQLPQNVNRPGEIDNSKLVSAETINGSEEPELQRTLREGEDYTLVPQEVWRRLYGWYLMRSVFACFWQLKFCNLYGAVENLCTTSYLFC
jgi:ubiquitin carboxyl-terminal hydrolase 4/11/15